MSHLKLKQIRLKFDDNQQIMAGKLGITQSYYSALERGKKAITSQLLSKIFNELGVSPTWWYSSAGDILVNEQTEKSESQNEKDYKEAIEIHLGKKRENLDFIKANLDLLRLVANKKRKYNQTFFKQLNKANPSLKDLYDSLSVIEDFSFTLNALDESKVGETMNLFKTFLEDPALTTELPPLKKYNAERLNALAELEPFADIFKRIASCIKEFQLSLIKVGEAINYNDDFTVIEDE